MKTTKYEITLTVKTPLFIGSGETISKKEYAINGNKVEIYDPIKLYNCFSNIDQYEKFMLESSNIGLSDYAKQQKLQLSNFKGAVKYSLDKTPDIEKVHEISAFIKDAYGLPYIPGSSLKGVIRTVFLSQKVKKPEAGKNDSYSKYRNQDIKFKRDFGISGDELEVEAFGKIQENLWKGVRISDSLPLEVENLILAKKIDFHIKKGVGDNKKQQGLPIYKEALKPGTVIKFIMSIDDTVIQKREDGEINLRKDDKFSEVNNSANEKNISACIRNFLIRYKSEYFDKFKVALNENRDFKNENNSENMIYLGGGVGYVSKTVAYSFYGDKAIDKVSGYLSKTFDGKGKYDHKHREDKSLGVSPHMLKLTRYNNKLVEMGLCSIEIKEI